MIRPAARRLAILGLVLAIAACGEPSTGGAESSATPQDDAAATGPAAVGRGTDAAPPVASSALPAPGAIRFDGFGPAPFGSDAEALRIAWGPDLGSADPAIGEECHYLSPQPQADGPSRIAFMIEGGRFVRLDVAAQDILAPGGGRVGMDADEISGIYPGRVSRSPHKYSDGAYLRVPDAAGDGVLVFETDDAGKVTKWRVGLPPQVDYVEGCS